MPEPTAKPDKPERRTPSQIPDEEIKAALATHENSIQAAARQLGTERTALTHHVKKKPWFTGKPAKRRRQVDLDERDVKKALEKHRGVLVEAAKQLKCSRAVLVNFLESKPWLKKVAEQEREAVKDLLESTAWTLAIGVPDPKVEGKWKVRPDSKLLEKLLTSFVQDRGYYVGPQFGQGNPDQKIVINIGGKFVEEDDPADAIDVEHVPLDPLDEIPGSENA